MTVGLAGGGKLKYFLGTPEKSTNQIEPLWTFAPS